MEAHAQHVVFCDIDDAGARAALVEGAKLADKRSKFSGRAVRVDVADEASVQAMVDFVLKAYGRIDYFVNCAGVRRVIPHHSVSHHRSCPD